jgi:hypothetical protein
MCFRFINHTWRWSACLPQTERHQGALISENPENTLNTDGDLPE